MAESEFLNLTSKIVNLCHKWAAAEYAAYNAEALHAMAEKIAHDFCSRYESKCTEEYRNGRSSGYNDGHGVGYKMKEEENAGIHKASDETR